MKKIVHIITDLNSGGAEHMLFKVLKSVNRTKYKHIVISLMDKGVYGEQLEELGIEVICINMTLKNIFPSIKGIKDICKDASIIDTWLYHADLVGFIISKILLKKKLIWNVRQSNLSKEANKWSTLFIIKLNAYLSKKVDIITYNSKKALENHELFGFCDKKSCIIPNGFELDIFKFYPESRDKIRKKLRIEKNKTIITVGRWDIQKDYYTLFKALNIVQSKYIDFRIIMVGTNLDESNGELIKLINMYNLTQQVILLGRRSDIPQLLSAADIYVSSSLGESFSNSIAEAMACEVPCVVTDVGDSKAIVDDTGVVVPSKNHKSLSEAILSLLNRSEMQELKKSARKRIKKHYPMQIVVKIFEDVYNQL